MFLTTHYLILFTVQDSDVDTKDIDTSTECTTNAKDNGQDVKQDTYPNKETEFDEKLLYLKIILIFVYGGRNLFCCVSLRRDIEAKQFIMLYIELRKGQRCLRRNV